MHEDAIFIIAV